MTHSSPPATVVLLLQDLLFGGTQRQTLELAKRLDRSRFSPQIWTMMAGSDFSSTAQQYDVPVRVLADTPAVKLSSLTALRRALAETRPDILMPLTAVPNIWGRIFARLAKVPVVIGTCRGGGAIRRQHERFLARIAHHHICNTAALKTDLVRLGRPDKNVTVIKNGIDCDFFAPPPDELRPVRLVILCLARFCEDKDHETLLRAFETVAAKHPAAELWLVGDGPMSHDVSKQVSRHKAKSRIRIYPASSDVRPFLQQASILALSSVREGMPNVILEAMASGVSVVATSVGGIPEVVRDNETGLLVEPRNPDALAQALLSLIIDDARRLAMGQAGRRKAHAEFSMDVMVNNYHDVFSRLLGTTSSHGTELS
ncbi:glycosyltransferase family 4 protein [Desulfovibrio inopinatus]|uniref:glycosyltransferase family 4 protein n=1 Tax=Desulfovibrio inopinatus TaxID=102109 RepID=UPI000685FCC0|nr:glycosyltransferase family 4 protein [Desulfovibrio inopinatus]